jgi:guanosine-3',5'-bis(diphosphate) 3'-pyrophosphohydrolase
VSTGDSFLSIPNSSRVTRSRSSQDWLKFVVTHRAGNKIRAWYSRERREDAKGIGFDDLVKALRREGLPVQKIRQSKILDSIAVELNYADLDGLYAAIGGHHQSAESVADRVRKQLEQVAPGREEQLPTTVRARKRSSQAGGHPSGVHVEGLDDVLVRLSRCCTPVPGDEIMGFVTRGRGVSVHRSDCANAVSLAMGQSDRLIDVEWDTDIAALFVASIEVKGLDRSRLLRDVSTALAEHHVNIVACNTLTGSDRISSMRFDFELGEVSQLEPLLWSIKQIDGIYDAYRVLPGKNEPTPVSRVASED